jgi:hypothetical protein
MGHSAFAGIIFMGNGKGNLVKTDMSGLRPGDTIAIRAGAYGYSQFRNLSHITIINHGGRVSFANESVEFADNNFVSFSGTGTPGMKYGFYFYGQQRDAITTYGNHTGCTWSHIEFRNCRGGNGVINTQDAKLQFDGVQDKTKEHYLCRFLNLHLVRCNGLVGNYSGPALNVQDSCEYGFITVDSSLTVSEINAGSIYRADIHHWILNGTMVSASEDVGVFQISGNVRIHHCIRTGPQWGWFLRLRQLSLGEARSSYVFNNIDLGSATYGFIDYRMSDQVANHASFSGGNLYACNNTVGNYRNSNNYVTPILLNYGSGAFHAEVCNNLRFHSANKPGSAPSDTTGVIDYSGSSSVVSSNNLYYQDPIRDGVLKDTIKCFLEPSGPAVDAGLTLTFVVNDFDNIRRPQGRAYDIGARECSEPRALPAKELLPGHSKSQLWLLSILSVLATGIIFVFRWGVRDPKELTSRSR